MCRTKVPQYMSHYITYICFTLSIHIYMLCIPRILKRWAHPTDHTFPHLHSRSSGLLSRIQFWNSFYSTNVSLLSSFSMFFSVFSYYEISHINSLLLLFVSSRPIAYTQLNYFLSRQNRLFHLQLRNFFNGFLNLSNLCSLLDNRGNTSYFPFTVIFLLTVIGLPVVNCPFDCPGMIFLFTVFPRCDLSTHSTLCFNVMWC